MTGFEPIRFDPGECGRELAAFAALLQAHERLSERQQVLPFFRQHRQLTAFLGSYFSPSIVVPDRVAYELDLFGAFTADVVVGDWERKAFCLVEFEDGAADSVFVRRGRATTEWAPRFEHGMGQIIDWYWKLADLGGTASLAQIFGATQIEATVLLVVASRLIHCYTFDELERDPRRRLARFSGLFAAESG